MQGRLMERGAEVMSQCMIAGTMDLHSSPQIGIPITFIDLCLLRLKQEFFDWPQENSITQKKERIGFQTASAGKWVQELQEIDSGSAPVRWIGDADRAAEEFNAG
jgi:hypothetical protein